VGSDITLRFTDDGTWQKNIKEVDIGSKKLVPNTDYTITDGAITLNHSLFTAGQKINVVIKSEGYVDALVQDQVIGYLVTFESNGGDSIAPQIVDRSATKPADPTKVGYKFTGWYTDQALTKPFDFTSIVTSPITLYAKYALAASLVTTDSTDNVVGNDMTLDFSDSDWAKAITGITVGGSNIDATKYKVDTSSQTITLDKSLFTKAGDFTISISAKDYADVTVIQKVGIGYNVHFVVQGNAPFEVKDQIVARRITQPVVYGYDLTWFADEACTIPWDFTNSIYSDRTLYGKWTLHKFSVTFDHQDGSLVDSKTADYNTTTTAPAVPTRPGYAFLGWYKDPAGKTAWNFATDKVAGDVRLYAKWITGVENNGQYNKDVTITFDEATAILDGKNFTSGTAVTSEGDHTLVVTDAAGNATTVQFTIDKTAPIVFGVSNDGTYNHDVTVTFNKGTATLNGDAFTSGTVVSHEGTYTLIVTDKAGNVTTVEFTIDKTAPNAPTINSVSDSDTLVTGTTEANVTVFVKSNNTIIGTGTSDSNGTYRITISKQKAGTVLTVFVKDAAGNESASAKVTVNGINHSPVVDDVQVSTTEKTVISGKITGEDPDNDTLTYTKSTDPQHGTVTVSSDGSWSYTPNDGFVGDDEFKVLVSDGKGGSAIVTVKVKVNPAPNTETQQPPSTGTQQPPSNLSQLPKTGSIWDRNLLLQIAGIITVMGALLHFFRRRKREKESN
jgi:uncharacterized repeat protein (TIGR02543 family)